ncbi:MAG: histone deacetylase [Bacteroidota bacterium]
MLKIAWNELYCHPLPVGHRFPMEKYDLIPQQLLYEGSIQKENIFSPEKLNRATIEQTHDPFYVEKLISLNLDRHEERRTGFPQSRQLVEREMVIMGGTVQCAKFALQYGISLNVAGGTHHAFSNKGEGFCLLNDIAIATNFLLQNERIGRVLIIDLDVHQGNGTAQIFSNNSNVFTFSMHGEKNYPMHKEKSDLDIGLQDGCKDEEFLRILEMNLLEILDDFKPEFIFYQCGVDVLETDKLGRLDMSIDGCKERDRKVIQMAYDLKLPICCSMGGGYSEKIQHIIEAHSNTFRLAKDIYF